jgi:hypothetical protein
MIGSFGEYVAKVEEMLADPERTDPARLAKADQMLPKYREHWDSLIEISRPLLDGSMHDRPVDFVDFIMTAAVATGLPPDQISAVLAVGLLRSYETARRRYCGVAFPGDPRLTCALPHHLTDLHVGLSTAGVAGGVVTGSPTVWNQNVATSGSGS